MHSLIPLSPLVCHARQQIENSVLRGFVYTFVSTLSFPEHFGQQPDIWTKIAESEPTDTQHTLTKNPVILYQGVPFFCFCKTCAYLDRFYLFKILCKAISFCHTAPAPVRLSILSAVYIHIRKLLV